VFGQPEMMAADLRMHNFAVFGVALLIAILPRARRASEASVEPARDPSLRRSTLEA
jgi:hypothetical protein